jgi:ATP-dependent exoDNAse (exonuclease V) beta subunit
LDFPVVLLYLPSLPTGGEYGEKAADSLARNLIYVAMTRAMDNLNVFLMEEAREGAGGAGGRDERTCRLRRGRAVTACLTEPHP